MARAPSLRRIDHVALRVASLDEAVPRWCVQFGLTESEREDGRAFLRCGYEPYSLELIEGGRPGFDHHAFELAARSLAGRHSVATRPCRRRLRARRRRPPSGRPGRERCPARPLPASGWDLARRRALDRPAAGLSAAQARPHELPDRGPRRPDGLLHGRARNADHGRARRRRRLVPRQRRSSRPRLRGQGLSAPAPPRLRDGRLGRAPGRVRPPRPARPLACVGTRSATVSAAT